jgi:ectoine hydroxylase
MQTIITEIKNNGYARLDSAFSLDEVGLINRQIKKHMTLADEGTTFEEDGTTVRGLHGLHLHDDFFQRITRHEKLLKHAELFLGEACYVHQLKINIKKRMTGQAWPWHQDYIFWKEGDGVPTANLINVGILLDDVEILHGPLCIIEKSHHLGEMSNEVNGTEKNWQQDLSKELTYQIDDDVISRLLNENNVTYLTGKAGDVIFFDPLLAHCSSENKSTYDRPFLIITYNAISNKPQHYLRPDFLCARNTSPLDIENCVSEIRN